MSSPAESRPVALRVTQASLNQTAFNFPRNVTNILTAIDEAVAKGSDLLCLEELALTGYDCGDDFQKTDNRTIAGLLRDIAAYAARKNPDLIISVGHPWRYSDKNAGSGNERHNNTLYNRLDLPFNAQSVISHGRVMGMTAKNYLFGYERGYEKRYFAEWNSAEADEAGGRDGTIMVPFPGQSEPIPFGRPAFRIATARGDFNLAQIICEEKWIASRYNQPHGTDADYECDGVAPDLARKLGRDGLLLVIPNASPPTSLKTDKHRHLAELASHYADAVIDTDGLGSSGSTFAQFGYRLAAQDGKIISSGSRLNFSRVATTTHDIAINTADAASAAHCHASFAHVSSANRDITLDATLLPAWDAATNPHRQTEETVRMACLWLFDYMRKTKCQGIAEALSGGADSAFNATLVGIMVRLAVHELGAEGFCREMPHLRYKDAIVQAAKNGGEEAATKACLANMLTCVYMGTKNSSAATRDAARVLVKGDSTTPGIGGAFMERNVQDLLDFYAVVYAVDNTSVLAPERKIALQTDLADYLNLRPGSIAPDALRAKAWELRKIYPEIEGDLLSAADPRHALAYENIQARARQVLIMLIANAEGKMAIANPNLDEARNAYATYGGDLHSGTINLNGFIPKAQELLIMQHLHDHGLEDVPPIRSLGLVLRNKPSAELQPKNEKGEVEQNDEDALQRSFAQMNRISKLMLQERTGDYAERRLNPGEVYDSCRQDTLFATAGTAQLYNMVRFSYQRWFFSQHKIHASPITPTFGDNVDHQTSLRTPNLSGEDKAELTQLGIRLLFSLAQKEFGEHPPDRWNHEAESEWSRRALVDERFVDQFESELRRGKSANLEFDLNRLYERAREDGLETIFDPPPPQIAALIHQHATLEAV